MPQKLTFARDGHSSEGSHFQIFSTHIIGGQHVSAGGLCIFMY
jgi:hypothetical protein